MKEVYRAEDPTQAHLLCGMLQSEGIDAIVEGELSFGARGEAPLDMSTLPAICVVNDGDAERALELIQNYLNAERTPATGLSWKCPACGETLEGQFGTCWSCGAERPAGSG